MEEMNIKKVQKTDDIGYGIGVFVGAVTSVFAGTAIQEAEAAEVAETVHVEEPEETSQAVYPHVVFHTTDPTVNPEPPKPVPPKPEPPKPEPPKPEPTKPEPPEPEPQIRVLKVEPLTTDEGESMTVAYVLFEGHYGQIVDYDNDGIADLAGIDLNGNGQIEEEEITFVRDCMISMQALREAAESSEFLASIQGPDYINDADVSDFMA